MQTLSYAANSVANAGPTEQDALSSNDSWFLAFTSGSVLFGLPLQSVERVARMAMFSPLPEAPAHVLGVLQVAGEPVPVVDPAVRLGQPQTPIQPDEQLILAVTKKRRLAVRVQNAGEVFAVADAPDGGNLKPDPVWPGLLRAGKAVPLEGETALIFDPEAFFTAKEERQLQTAMDSQSGAGTPGGKGGE